MTITITATRTDNDRPLEMVIKQTEDGSVIVSGDYETAVTGLKVEVKA